MAACIHPTDIPLPVRALLAWWLPRMRVSLGSSYQSTLLHGSVALGDFHPGWSDVDVCVVRSGQETDEQRRGLEALQRDTEARFLNQGADGWVSGQVIDATYVRSDQGDVQPAAFTDVFDLLSLSVSALHADGEPVTLPRPGRRELRSRLRRFVDEAKAMPTDASPIWFAAMIQLLARALVFWRDDELVSKSEALERVIAEGGDPAQAYALALQIRREGSATAASHEHALRSAYSVALHSALQHLVPPPPRPPGRRRS